MAKNDLLQYKKYDTHRYSCSRYTLTEAPVHWHNFYEMEIVLSGKGVHTINSVPYEWKRGEIHFLRLTDFHEVNLSREGEILIIQISPHYLPEHILNLASAVPGELVAYVSEEDIELFQVLFRNLYTEIYEKGLKNEELLKHLYCTAAYTFFDRCKSTQSAVPKELSDERISKIVGFIHKYFKDDITLEQISKEFFLNKNYLCTYFKKHMGITLLDYIKNTRLNYALKLVKSTNLKSIEICDRCGYSSASNFLKDFKKRYGCSPLQLRKKSKQ